MVNLLQFAIKCVHPSPEAMPTTTNQVAAMINTIKEERDLQFLKHDTVWIEIIKHYEETCRTGKFYLSAHIQVLMHLLKSNVWQYEIFNQLLHRQKLWTIKKATAHQIESVTVFTRSRPHRSANFTRCDKSFLWNFFYG